MLMLGCAGVCNFVQTNQVKLFQFKIHPQILILLTSKMYF